jgi:hypothetical protein
MFPAARTENLFILSGERVFGTHLYPVTHFAEDMERLPDPDTLTRVIRTIPTAGPHQTEVMLTRMSGLFVRVPGEYAGGGIEIPIDPEQIRRRAEMTEQAADAMNQVICELALSGITSDPASPIEIGMGFFANGRAGIASGGSQQNERVMDPVMRVMTQAPPFWFGISNSVPEEKLAGIEELDATRKLLTVSDALPAFIAAAYALFQRRLLAEALVDGWIVIEQVVNWLWREQYRPKAHDAAHRARLDDYRSFTANTKLETLLAAGAIQPELYDALQEARRRRNATAHGARVDLASAQTVVDAMRKTIEFVCGRAVAPPHVQQFVLG